MLYKLLSLFVLADAQPLTGFLPVQQAVPVFNGGGRATITGRPRYGTNFGPNGNAPRLYSQYSSQILDTEQSPLAPYARDVNPNAADEYLQRLYLHGRVLLNRAMARVGGPIRDGPLVVRFGVNTPAGYEPGTLDDLYAALFFRLGRCDSKYYIGRIELQSLRDNNVPLNTFQGDFYNNNDEIDLCLVKESQDWLDDFEEYVAEETQKVLSYVQANPRVAVVRTPTYANLLRVHTPREINAMLDTPLATYRLAEALINEARRIVNLNGPRFVPDLEGILSTPAAYTRFGFPGGFAVPNVEPVFANLVYRAFLCRTGNAVLSPQVAGWLNGAGPGGEFGEFAGFDTIEACIKRKVFDWYFDEFDDFVVDEVAPAVAAFVRPEEGVVDAVMEDYVQFAAPTVNTVPVSTVAATVAAPLVAPAMASSFSGSFGYPTMTTAGLDLSGIQFTQMATMGEVLPSQGMVLPSQGMVLPSQGMVMPSVMPSMDFTGDIAFQG